MKRRDFIKNIGLVAGSLHPLFRVGGGLSIAASTALASAPTSDYKAIVIISLDGGNDAMNTFPPTAAKAHAEYKEIRRNLGVLRTDLYEHEHYKVDNDGHYIVEGAGDQQPYWPDDGVPLGSEGNREGQYIVGSYHTKEDGVKTGLGIHAFMPEIASLYNSGKLSLVSNVGVLVEPTTKAQINDKTANLPLFLFSHLHQGKAVASMKADKLGLVGWAGRLADSWRVNGNIGLNISLTGNSLALVGAKTTPLLMGAGGIPAYKGSINGLLKDFATTTETNPFMQYYNNRVKNSVLMIEQISDAWSAAPNFSTFYAKNAYGQNLFESDKWQGDFRQRLGMRLHHGLDNRFLGSFASTAKMLSVSKNTLGNNRQIFYINSSGFDFHGNQVVGHSTKLRTLSLGISDFYKSLEGMGMEEEVLVILTSEFGRTMKSNEDGTDHGWGGHSFMLCGDPKFNGGKVFGEVMTDLKLNGENAFTNRARIIPTTSMEQMLAPALNWFGVDEATMKHVLPNLVNFKTTNDIESAYLQGVFS